MRVFQLLLGLAFLVLGSACWLRATGRLPVGSSPLERAPSTPMRGIAGILTFAGLFLIYTSFV
jgi:hypothetical protein